MELGLRLAVSLAQIAAVMGVVMLTVMVLTLACGVIDMAANALYLAAVKNDAQVLPLQLIVEDGKYLR